MGYNDTQMPGIDFGLCRDFYGRYICRGTVLCGIKSSKRYGWTVLKKF